MELWFWWLIFYFLVLSCGWNILRKLNFWCCGILYSVLLSCEMMLSGLIFVNLLLLLRVIYWWCCGFFVIWWNIVWSFNLLRLLWWSGCWWWLVFRGFIMIFRICWLLNSSLRFIWRLCLVCLKWWYVFGRLYCGFVIGYFYVRIWFLKK